MADVPEAPIHYNNAESFAWQAGYEAGLSACRQQANEPAKCNTVGELKAALAEYDDNLPLCSIGPDDGGYDAERKEMVEVYQTSHNGRLTVFVDGEGGCGWPPGD